MLARYGVHTPHATTTAAAATGPARGVHAGDAPAGLEELGDLDAVADVDSRALGSADVVGGCHRGLALGVDRAPHGTEEWAGGTRDDRSGLVGVEQLHIGQTGPMRLFDQTLQNRQLVLGSADVEVAADDEFEVALFGGLGPQLEGFLGERELGAMPALHPQRALCPARTLAGRPILLVQQHTAAPRAAIAAAVAAPTIPLPTTTTSTLRAMVMVGPPVTAGCGRRADAIPARRP